MNVPEHLDQKVCHHVMRDLRPSKTSLYGRLTFSLVFGGALSLLICGQFGIAGSSIASSFEQELIKSAGVLPCSVFCGSFFAILPVILLRMVSSPMLFKVIGRKSFLSSAMILLVISAVFTLTGQNPPNIQRMLLWFIAAFICFRFLLLCLNSVTPTTVSSGREELY